MFNLRSGSSFVLGLMAGIVILALIAIVVTMIVQTATTDAESARAATDWARATAESKRADAEAARMAESTRMADAESKRADAEAARMAESTRMTDAESTRADAEAARMAESTRMADAESTRADAEAARTEAESARMAAATVGLVAHWTFDEGSSDTTGIVGRVITGTLRGDPEWITDTAPVPYSNPYALSFDGVNDYVEIPHNSHLDLAQQLSIALWVRVDEFDKVWQALVTKGDSAWRLHRYKETNVLCFNANGPVGSSLQGKTEIADGQWHHVAAVYDGSAAYLYIDGQLDAEVKASGPIKTNDFDVYIGENAEERGRYFRGAMDDVRLYSRPLSPIEIEALAQRD